MRSKGGESRSDGIPAASDTGSSGRGALLKSAKGPLTVILVAMAAARYVDSDGDDETTLPPGSIYAPDDSATPQRTLWLATVLPFHYGYLILVACGIGLGMSGPGQTTTFGVLVGDEADPQSLMNETGVNRSSSSVLWMVATFGSAATMLRFGFWLDQLGPMKALAATAVLLGASLLLLSVCSSPAALFAGLYCLRLFGQGCMMLIPPYTVALWWVERRGFAYAITLSIGSIGINYGCEYYEPATAPRTRPYTGNTARPTPA